MPYDARGHYKYDIADSFDPELEFEANERIEDCRRHKAEWDLDMREAYFFAAPHRARNVSSRTPNTNFKPKDAGESNTSFACEMASDFATLIMNTFIPEAQKWCQREAGTDVPDAVKKKIDDQVQQDDQRIFDAIAASNFYAEFAKAAIPDMALGTIALWIEDKRPAETFVCQALPVHEVEIGLGPSGELDTRFYVHHTRYHHLKALIPDIPLPADIEEMIKDKAKGTCELRRGFWRDWDDIGDVCWYYVVMIGKRLIKTSKIKGEGCCPLIIARFGPYPEWAWAAGPLIQALPDFRHLDELAAAKIENLDLALRPPISFPDDSFVNLEEGIEAGMAYPVRPGSEGAIKHLYEAPSPQVAIYDRQDLEQRIKRLFFLDYPEQRGDTPPSATQWLDEMNKAQQRIGTPGLPFWREGPAQFFLRYQHMMEQRGTLQKIKVDGKTVALMPYNPAQRAAEQQEVAMAARAIQLAAEAFPEEFKVVVDGKMTIMNIVEKLGAGRIIKMRSQADIAQAIQHISALAQGTPGNAPAAATGAGQAPPVQNPAGLAPPPPTTQLRLSGR